jgi:hypothetical protein
MSDRASTSEFDLHTDGGVNTPLGADLKAIREALEWAGVEYIDGDRPRARLGRRK